MEICISNGHAVGGGSDIFLNRFTNVSIKGFLKTVVAVADKIKNHLALLEQL